mmetsp:Transcript_32995/g.80998  ORF Transcript_32995/g.80998 Transcript_32995/m.80998 type:complete len:204 (-) Transcript_32995:290-901(-)
MKDLHIVPDFLSLRTAVAEENKLRLRFPPITDPDSRTPCHVQMVPVELLPTVVPPRKGRSEKLDVVACVLLEKGGHAFDVRIRLHDSLSVLSQVRILGIVLFSFGHLHGTHVIERLIGTLSPRSTIGNTPSITKRCPCSARRSTIGSTPRTTTRFSRSPVKLCPNALSFLLCSLPLLVPLFLLPFHSPGPPRSLAAVHPQPAS